MIERAPEGYIRLRSPQARALHGSRVGHDVAEALWPVLGGLIAHCSCSQMIIHEITDAGTGCGPSPRRGESAPRVPHRWRRCPRERMADGRPLWRCVDCGARTSVAQPRGRRHTDEREWVHFTCPACGRAGKRPRGASRSKCRRCTPRERRERHKEGAPC